ncbi:MAG: hypothetical protein GXO71_04695 [Caldiserica bacterium]|nr:hypothetical protein [Caldisericota bacterium]
MHDIDSCLSRDISSGIYQAAWLSWRIARLNKLSNYTPCCGVVCSVNNYMLGLKEGGVRCGTLNWQLTTLSRLTPYYSLLTIYYL